MTKILDILLLLSPKKRLLLAFFAGVLAAFSMPPYGFFPILFLSFPLIILLMQSLSAAGQGSIARRHSFFIGWAFGFGYFLNGLWWVGMAFLVDQKFIALAPFAVMLLPAGLAVFYGLATLSMSYFRKISIFPFVFCLFFAEMARSMVFTGFPWNLFGYSLTQWLPLAQSASLFGVEGLTLLALALFATPAYLVLQPKKAKIALATPFLVLIAMAGFGYYRLGNHQTTFHEKIALRIMQPDIAQDAKFNRANKDRILNKYLALSDHAASQKRRGLEDITHLIWPESAFPFFLSEDKEALTKIAQSLSKNTVLITGAVRKGEQITGKFYPEVFNSILALNSAGEFQAAYDKRYLVPFGEFLPFQNLLDSLGLEPLTRMIGGFSAGSRRQNITLKDTPTFTPLICYEVIFSRFIVQDKRPEWLLSVTNDAWFGKTPGPYQHFHMAQVRAIEEGLAMVRAANNGISGVIDPLGRLQTTLALGESGVLDSYLPKALKNTFFTRFSLLLTLMSFLLMIAVYVKEK